MSNFVLRPGLMVLVVANGVRFGRVTAIYSRMSYA